MNLINKSDLPEWFAYSANFIRIAVEQRLIYFDPWRILEGDELLKRYQGLKERYPDRDLVPFAKRDDSDDVACWEKQDPEKVVIIHDFASPGWEQRDVFDSFWAWLRKALEDTIEYDG